MRYQPVIHRAVLIPALGVALTVAATACSSSSSSSSPGSAASASTSASAPSTGTSASAAPSAGGSSSAAVTAIKANWEAFFSPKTPASKKISLLQNGQTFASVVDAQNSSTLASSATSTVSAVTLESPTQAKVTYSILVGGAPALKDQPGVAVLQNGTWKVGDQSFCALLTLENNGKAPSVCTKIAG
jgi:hypothetical protein